MTEPREPQDQSRDQFQDHPQGHPEDGPQDYPQHHPEDPLPKNPARRTSPRRRPVRRLAVRLLELVAGLVGLVFLGLVVLGVRLEFGPIETDWLTPFLSASLTGMTHPLTVTVGGARLAWAADHRAVDVAFTDVKLCRATGNCLVDVPEGSVSFSVLGLLTGRMTPTRLALAAPSLHLIRRSDGGFDLDQMAPMPGGAIGDASPGTAQSPNAVQSPDPGTIETAIETAGADMTPLGLLRALSGAEGGDHPLGRLRSLVLRDVSVTVDDRVNKLTVGLDRAAVRFTRQDNGLALAFEGEMRLGDVRTGVTFRADYQKSTDLLTYRVDLNQVDPARLAAVTSLVPASVRGVHLVANATLEGILSLAVGVKSGMARLYFDTGAGQIVDPHLSGGRLDIARLGGMAVYQPDQHRLVLDQFAVDFGGPSVELTASINHLPDLGAIPAKLPPLFVAASIQAKAMPFDRLPAYWPPDLAPNPRRWIAANLSVGRIDQVDTTALLEIDPVKGTDLIALVGRLKARGTTIDYLHGLPKLEAVDALIDMTADRMDFALTAGRVRGLVLQQAAIVIDQFDAPVERITIDLGLKGPARDVMGILDSPPLRYGQAVGIDPTRIAGAIEGGLHFRFPLKRTLPFAEIDYGAKATLAGFGLPNAALGRDLTDGAFAVVLDHNNLTLDGAAKLDGVASNLVFTQRLIGTAPPKMQLRAKTILDDGARDRFGLGGMPGLLTGPIGAEVAYRDEDGHKARADIVLDLTDSAIVLDPLAYQKPAGVAAKAALALVVEEGALTAVTGVQIKAPALDILGNARLTGGQVARVTLDRVRLGETDLSADLTRRGETYGVKLRAGTLDLGPALKARDEKTRDEKARDEKTRDEKARDEKTANDGVAEEAVAANGPRYQLDLKAERVLIGPGREIHDLNANMTLAEDTVERGTLIASLGRRKAGIVSPSLSFSLDAVRDGGAFSIATDDLGQALKIADVTESVAGGSLSITGKSRIYHKGRRFEGHVEGKDYRIVQAPLIARLLALPSFSSVTSLLSGDGIPFSTLKADIALSDHKLDLVNALAYGGAIGVNVAGGIDFKRDTIALDGTVAPAYTVNSVLGDVPILGDLLVGGSGQGLFAAKFRVAGPLGKPLVSVNPLSALAPGFLRNLFLFDAPDPMRK